MLWNRLGGCGRFGQVRVAHWIFGLVRYGLRSVPLLHSFALPRPHSSILPINLHSLVPVSIAPSLTLSSLPLSQRSPLLLLPRYAPLSRLRHHSQAEDCRHCPLRLWCCRGFVHHFADGESSGFEIWLVLKVVEPLVSVLSDYEKNGFWLGHRLTASHVPSTPALR